LIPTAIAEADVAFHVTFSSSSGRATATVYRATGLLARESGPVGEVVIGGAPVSLGDEVHVTEANDYRFFAGIRSDPHFKDPKGLHNGFQFTGEDPIALRDVVGIVLEVPNGAFASSPPVGIWARTTRRVDGIPTIIDQAGLPATNNTFNPEEADNAAFSVTPPSEQAAAFGGRFADFLGKLGYSETESIKLARSFLPDVLHYNWLEPAGFRTDAASLTTRPTASWRSSRWAGSPQTESDPTPTCSMPSRTSAHRTTRRARDAARSQHSWRPVRSRQFACESQSASPRAAPRRRPYETQAGHDVACTRSPRPSKRSSSSKPTSVSTRALRLARRADLLTSQPGGVWTARCALRHDHEGASLLGAVAGFALPFLIAPTPIRVGRVPARTAIPAVESQETDQPVDGPSLID